MRVFSSADDDELIRELLPFIQPHEGVMRAQLHRTQGGDHTERLQFTFAFTCAHCDVRRNAGYEITLREVEASYTPVAQIVGDKMAGHLRSFCEEIREMPCMGVAERGELAERVTAMLGLHGSMNRQEFEAAWVSMHPEARLEQALLIAKHLGFEPVDGLFMLPADHPWNLPDDPT